MCGYAPVSQVCRHSVSLQVGFAALRLARLLTGVLGEHDGTAAALPDSDEVLLPLMLASAGLASLTAGRDASVSAPLSVVLPLRVTPMILQACCQA